MTARNTTVRCGHLSLSRVALRNKTFLPAGARGELGEEERRRGGRKDAGVERDTRGGDAADASTPSLVVSAPPRSLLSLFSPGEACLPQSPSSLLILPLLPFATPPPPRVLYLALRTYSVFPSPRPIYLPPRVAEWILFVSHRYFAGPPFSCAARPPKLSRRHDLCFLRPSGGLIPFCVGCIRVRRCPAPPSPCPVCLRAREHTNHPHTTDYPSARHAVDGLLVPQVPSRSSFPASFETSFQRFRHPLLRCSRLPHVSSFDGAL